MPFSLGFTADAAAAHRHEYSQATACPMFQLPQSLGFVKPLKDGIASPPAIITPRPSQTDLSSSSGDEEEGDNEQQNDARKARKYTMPRQVASRPKTLYQFAHPVASRRRLKFRPKLLLQLHETHNSSRPFPKYDILPPDMTTKLVCRLSRPLGSTRAFGSKDLVIVTSDMYEQVHAGDDRSVSSDESCGEQREVVATICQCGPASEDHPRGSKVEVALSSGACWEGIPLANGSYELVSKSGIAGSKKIRWVARDRKPRQGTGLSSSTASSAPSSPGRFTFSVINPNTRRHAVIASMTRKGLTVFDQYSPTVQGDDEHSPPTSPSTASMRSGPEVGLINTDEELRQLIVMTGTWVAFMEGWSTKSLSNGDTSRTVSPLSPRIRSSTYLSVEGDPSMPDKSAKGPSTPTPSTSRMNSFSRRKMINRRSTHSEISRDRLSEYDASSETRRRSKSLTADPDSRWTDIEVDKAIEDGNRYLSVDPVRQQDTDDTHEEEDSKAKKKWRRLSSMFGRKKH
ncbi:conserved hypothetical protein [Talaromyces stipitatus ATCC 10500]|uniref:Uncharacterized protein n=1 Tax=Talaromyces stipitatus (strain ATCC 10500 / CBS 375.48 / QM 6759 / NRRL 1006) TaxID=441959 RepID=B8LW23_TALSN|nr:uncharacterized protein TSTA_077500 [Talaromyces stipitatus ATCC 10500]EED24389.1 conserved hypothetical protein [Talaromyces stipitatus ATCC 10500]